MPVLTNTVLNKGWKKDENGRFGPAVVMQFVNSADGSVLFEFAPTLEDQPRFIRLFESMYAVDNLNTNHYKELQSVQARQEKELRELCGKLNLKSEPYFKAIASDSFKSASVGCKK